MPPHRAQTAAHLIPPVPGPDRPSGGHSTTPAAVRARRSRARRRQGTACLRVETDEFRLAEALLRAGRLNESEALQRPLIERELTRLVGDWCLRWLGEK